MSSLGQAALHDGHGTPGAVDVIKARSKGRKPGAGMLDDVSTQGLRGTQGDRITIGRAALFSLDLRLAHNFKCRAAVASIMCRAFWTAV